MGSLQAYNMYVLGERPYRHQRCLPQGWTVVLRHSALL